jgi:glycosyltransferase involved in cell wall biosynthesis
VSNDAVEERRGGVLLSVCVATFRRAEFLAATLDSIVEQLEGGVELVIVDGASPDRTPAVVAPYLARFPAIRYFREEENSGVDRDYDKAVGYARGEYCWLMTDDDLLKPGAIRRVLGALREEGRSLILVNAEVRNADLSQILVDRKLLVPEDRTYGLEDRESFFAECLNYLSFIGCVVIRRTVWLGRDRDSYFGTLFVHVGVILQPPWIGNVHVVSDPLVTIRYGNALWTSRGFEIWAFKWPGLVWSFPEYADETKRLVCPREPWVRIKMLFYYRAIGAFSLGEFRRFVAGRTGGIRRAAAFLTALLPGAIANLISVLYFAVCNKSALTMKYDLLRSSYATHASRWLSQVIWR